MPTPRLEWVAGKLSISNAGSSSPLKQIVTLYYRLCQDQAPARLTPDCCQGGALATRTRLKLFLLFQTFACSAFFAPPQIAPGLPPESPNSG